MGFWSSIKSRFSKKKKSVDIVQINKSVPAPSQEKVQSAISSGSVTEKGTATVTASESKSSGGTNYGGGSGGGGSSSSGSSSVSINQAVATTASQPSQLRDEAAAQQAAQAQANTNRYASDSKVKSAIQLKDRYAPVNIGLRTTPELPTDRYRRQAGQDFLVGVIPKTPGELAITGASFGVGAAVGAGVRGGGAVIASKAPKLLPYAEKAVTLGGGVLGGLYVKQKGEEATGRKLNINRGGVSITKQEDFTSQKFFTRLGSTTREATAFGSGVVVGTKGAATSIGLWRTKGKTAAQDLIAPEYPVQRYPKIKSGQTAGQLQREFKPDVRFDSQAGGFSATPIPLKSGSVLAGSSELKGLYLSPKLNPTFTKIGGSSSPKLFGKQSFGGALPTAYRVTAEGGVKLSQGVSPSQRRLNPLSQAKRTLTASEGSGTIEVPFIKTEKEGIATFGSTLTTGKSNYYVSIKGERVPVETARITRSKPIEPVKPVDVVGKPSRPLKSSSRSGDSYGIINPTAILGGSAVSLSRGRSSSGVGRSSGGGSPSSSGSDSPSVSPSYPSPVSPTPVIPSYSSSRSPKPSGVIIPTSYSYTPSSIPKPIYSSKGVPRGLGGGALRGAGLKRLPTNPSGRRYLPSFSALAFGIKGKAKKSTTTGIGFRPIPKGFSLAKFAGATPRKIVVKKRKDKK